MEWDQALSIVSLIAAIGGGAGIVLVTRARVERLEQDIRDLKSDKASKEAVDTLGRWIADMKADLGRRLDHIEEMLRSALGGER